MFFFMLDFVKIFNCKTTACHTEKKETTRNKLVHKLTLVFLPSHSLSLLVDCEKVTIKKRICFFFFINLLFCQCKSIYFPSVFPSQKHDCSALRKRLMFLSFFFFLSCLFFLFSLSSHRLLL